MRGHDRREWRWSERSSASWNERVGCRFTKPVAIVTANTPCAYSGVFGQASSELARRVGGRPTAQQVAVAAQQRLTFTRKLLSDTYSAPHLMSLKSRDYQLGVVTDCSAEMPLSWISTWLKVRGFPSGLGHETAESAPCVEAVQID